MLLGEDEEEEAAAAKEASRDWARTACSSDLLQGMFNAAAACWTASGVNPASEVMPNELNDCCCCCCCC